MNTIRANKYDRANAEKKSQKVFLRINTNNNNNIYIIYI